MLIFLDLETTGLDEREHQILEVAAIITDDGFGERARFQRVLNVAQHVDYAGLDPFVRDMHFKNGLWMESLRAALTDTSSFVDGTLANLIQQTCGSSLGERNGPLLAGNTISFDRRFIRRYMPMTEKLLHYRMFDCTTLNELARRAWPAVYDGRGKSVEAPHRALHDVQESLELARYYRGALAAAPPKPVF